MDREAVMKDYLKSYKEFEIKSYANTSKRIMMKELTELFKKQHEKKAQIERKQKQKEKKKEYTRKYREENKEKIAEKYKIRYEANKETIAEYARKYREENKASIDEKKYEKFNCPCGGKYLKCDKSKHFKTKKHIKYVEQLKKQ
jgi:hypothetical protein